MNKELEEAIKQYITHAQYFINQEDRNAIETIIEAAENSISKEVIKENLEELRNIEVDGEVFTTAVNFAIKILQELLEQK